MAVGLKDVIVVAMADAVLVLDKDKSQSVKEIVDLLDQQKFSQAYEQRRQFRPWGWFETLVLADRISSAAGAFISANKNVSPDAPEAF